MDKAKKGGTVKIYYTGKLEDGEIFDSSKEREPLEFTIGSGSLIPGIEKGVIGMETGDTKDIEVAPEEAFGPRRKELVVEVSKAEFPEEIRLQLGLQLQMQQPDGDAFNVIVVEMNEDTVTLDANHPLAGHTLYFNVELIEIT